MPDSQSPRPVALVTGAGAGIGRAVALGLAARNHDLVLVARTRQRLDEVGAACREHGVDAFSRPADLAQPDSAAAIIVDTIERFGRIDVLVNNAGAAPLAPIAETTPDLLQSVFAVNVNGPALLIAAAWPTLVAQGRGRIVNVSSMATLDPFPGFYVYAASKAAVESLARSVENEGAEHGIEAYSVAPGAVETGMLRALFDEEALPASGTLDPADVASVIIGCATGDRIADRGTVITVPNPS